MRETPKAVSPKSPSIIKQALTVNRKPFPWGKAFCAGLAASLPVFIGLLFANLEYGLIAGMGGFTYLYVFNIPFAQRAKKLFFVVLGMTLVSALGTLAAPYPLAVAILMGIIGAATIFIFGALKIIGPSAIFFVLVFAMTSGMPVHPELVLLRAGLVFLGGALSWVVAMIGWFSDPHGPETGVVKKVYSELASFLESVGTEKFNETRHKVMSDLKEAEETLAVGYIPWRNTDIFNRLVILNDHANTIFLYVLENFSKTNVKLPPELGVFIREIAHSLDLKNKNESVAKKILLPEKMDEAVLELFKKISDADAIMNEPTSKINQVIQISKPSLMSIFLGAFDKNSIVFINAVRFGIITTIANIIAYQFEFTRPFWIPLSCVAVMSGSTIVATYHRAIQRAFGTILGILMASLILMTHPTGLIIAVLILLLTFMTELFIVKNYGLAALFFTPNALLMAESTSHGSFTFTYFASARLIDIIIGIFIGLIGVFFIGRQSASSRLPHLITKTIRSQAQLLFILFSDQGTGYNARKSREIIKMRTNLNNLKTLYNTAAGEIPVNQKALEYYWPVIFSLEHLGYLLDNCSKNEYRPIFSDETLSQLLYVCETMAIAANRKQSPTIKNVPEMEGLSSIQNEIITLQKSLQIDGSVTF
ncbi:FUSC family protein [Neobacillus cucumis]|uniref:FUSC family protein n=1 Tax=Neobacillus cucumis TaxID=1740721 RepID=UPI001962EA6B|nr:FUSC family protein [Neobacillus cucumis]MBM7651186.1 putative membrane protein YccC [Neobacillus cucumis]